MRRSSRPISSWLTVFTMKRSSSDRKNTLPCSCPGWPARAAPCVQIQFVTHRLDDSKLYKLYLLPDGLTRTLVERR